jgi:hypothetical protein
MMAKKSAKGLAALTVSNEPSFEVYSILTVTAPEGCGLACSAMLETVLPDGGIERVQAGVIRPGSAIHINVHQGQKYTLAATDADPRHPAPEGSFVQVNLYVPAHANWKSEWRGDEDSENAVGTLLPGEAADFEQSAGMALQFWNMPL